MKRTWFGGTTIRIHIGGDILVCGAEAAPDGIDRVELESGANRTFRFAGNSEPRIDLAAWKPRRRGALLDENRQPDVNVWHTGAGVLIDAVGEPPLLLLSRAPDELGRWAGNAVLVLFGDEVGLVETGRTVLSDEPPRMLALAGEPDVVESAFSALRDCLDGAGLIVLEKGMAIEV
jgi:hypothetical protein